MEGAEGVVGVDEEAVIGVIGVVEYELEGTLEGNSVVSFS